MLDKVVSVVGQAAQPARDTFLLDAQVLRDAYACDRWLLLGHSHGPDLHGLLKVLVAFGFVHQSPQIHANLRTIRADWRTLFRF